MNNEYYDEAASLKQERVARTPDMVNQRRAVMSALALQPGESVLDVGSGNGIFAREMLDQVGTAGTVVGVDPAKSMVSMSRTLCPDASFHRGDASELPFESTAFDAVTASQVLCFVPNVDAALKEMHRVLRPGGRLVVLDTDWDTLLWNCNDESLREEVVAELTSPYTSAKVPRTLSRRLSAAGFDGIERKAHPIVNWDFIEESYSAQLASFLPAADGDDNAGIDLRSAWHSELTAMAARGEYAFSLNRFIFCASKP